VGVVEKEGSRALKTQVAAEGLKRPASNVGVEEKNTKEGRLRSYLGHMGKGRKGEERDEPEGRRKESL